MTWKNKLLLQMWHYSLQLDNTKKNMIAVGSLRVYHLSNSWDIK